MNALLARNIVRSERGFPPSAGHASYTRLPAAIIAVGKKMIETAPFPPIDRNIKSLLMSLDAAYRLNAEGPNIGGITTEFHDDTSATSVWTSMGPCPLNIGIIQGCCSKLGIHAIVEHAPGECMDKGGASCTYHISF